MEFNFLIGKIMGNNTMGRAVKEGLTAVAAAAVLSTSPASAETAQHEINKVTCTTKASCEQLSLSIQAQIDELEAKGFRKLSRQEKIKYDQLTDNLIAVEKQETAQNEELIATKDVELKKEKQETADGNKLVEKEKSETQRAYTEVKDKLASIEGSLL